MSMNENDGHQMRQWTKVGACVVQAAAAVWDSSQRHILEGGDHRHSGLRDSIEDNQLPE